MSVEISIWLDSRRAKQGDLYPVKLRVYYQGKVIPYPTVYDLSKGDFQKLNAKRISEDLGRLRGTFKEIEDSASDAAKKIYPFDFDKFYSQFIYGNQHFKIKKKSIEKATGKNNLPTNLQQEWLKKFPVLEESHPGPDYISTLYAEVIKNLLKQERVGNASSFHCSYSSLKSFASNLRLKEITVQFLIDYETWMKSKGNSLTTVGIYLRALRFVMNEAIEAKVMKKDDYPFGRRRFRIPKGKKRKIALKQPIVAALFNAETEKTNREKARDYWFFIFEGNGMNVKDLINLKYKNIEGEFLSFQRAKTEFTTRDSEPIIVKCLITENMWKIIEKWGNKDKDPENYIFPILSRGQDALQQFYIKQNFTRFINKNMIKLSNENSLEVKPITIMARKTVANILRSSDTNPHDIKETLGHTSVLTQENYVNDSEDERKKEVSKILSDYKVRKNLDQAINQ